jgi:hypothetical protein
MFDPASTVSPFTEDVIGSLQFNLKMQGLKGRGAIWIGLPKPGGTGIFSGKNSADRFPGSSDVNIECGGIVSPGSKGGRSRPTVRFGSQGGIARHQWRDFAGSKSRSVNSGKFLRAVPSCACSCMF